MSDMSDVNDVNDINVADDVNDADDDDFEEGDDYEEGDINVVGAGPEPARLPADVLTYLAEQLADDPEAVEVDADHRGGSVRLTLRVAQGDMGRVIGRRGRTAQALRTLVAVAGARDGVQTNVDIADD
jgi:predicted RNA-binding protein YlqC (UPF0109 family)